jgi:hypothetical protein
MEFSLDGGSLVTPVPALSDGNNDSLTANEMQDPSVGHRSQVRLLHAILSISSLRRVRHLLDRVGLNHSEMRFSRRLSANVAADGGPLIVLGTTMQTGRIRDARSRKMSTLSVNLDSVVWESRRTVTGRYPDASTR